MSKYIKDLIKQGEHQQLDFKFEVSDYGKIARSLVAFANTDGGKLLIGIKDNGAVAGVRSEEEYFMIEGAATMYCRPEVSFTSREWEVDGKKVLEIDVIKGSHASPHRALDKDGKWRIYIRSSDQNLLAHRILLKLWRREQSSRGTYITFGDKEKQLLQHLEKYKSTTIGEVKKITGINTNAAEVMLLNFTMLGIIEMIITEKLVRFTLKEGYERKVREINDDKGLWAD